MHAKMTPIPRSFDENIWGWRGRAKWMVWFLFVCFFFSNFYKQLTG
jgi:hypothetical protein